MSQLSCSNPRLWQNGLVSKPREQKLIRLIRWKFPDIGQADATVIARDTSTEMFLRTPAWGGLCAKCPLNNSCRHYRAMSAYQNRVWYHMALQFVGAQEQHVEYNDALGDDTTHSNSEAATDDFVHANFIEPLVPIEKELADAEMKPNVLSPRSAKLLKLLNENLSKRDLEILNLKFVDDLTHKEIAKELNISVAASSQRLCRAVRRAMKTTYKRFPDLFDSSEKGV